MELTEKKPKVSVCVVTYNQEKYIRQCLQSVVDQETDFDFEVIVGDDSSTDGTSNIIQEFTEKYPFIIKPIFHKINIGASNNYLSVHDIAKGVYIAHMDGDDYALQGKLQAQANILDAEAACTAVWHSVDYFDDEDGFCSGETADLSLFENGKVTFSDAIRLGFVGVHSSLMYRRTARQRVPFDQKILDIYVTWDLLSKGTGYILKEVFGRYRMAALGSVTVSSQRGIRLLSISHAKHFLKKFPKQRKNYFIWAFCRAIADAKNFRLTAFAFIYFAMGNISYITPTEIISNSLNIRKIQVRWKQRIHLKKELNT